MRKILVFGAALGAAATVIGSAAAADPVPYPAPKVEQVFIATQTVTPDGAMGNYFAPGGTIVFRAYAVDTKTRKVAAAKDVRFFYVTIPNQPNVRLKYDPSAPGASNGLPWTGTWTVPADYPSGIVAFRTLIQLKTTHRKGQYVQFPVSAAQLTISKTPPPTFGPGANAGAAGAGAGTLVMSLYVDSVNGTRPPGAAPRAAGCSQTNVFKRGEQFVLRAWGTDLETGDVLSNENIKEAHFSVAGQPDTVLNWGAHGTDPNRVFFWSNAWNIPASFPLGETTVHVVFTSDTGKTGTYDHVINIIP
jgi:hypothetical protein